jgi:hypothetical protein
LVLVATSVLALASHGAARAACVPDAFGSSILCSGVEPGGLRLTQSGFVSITDGALVTAPAGAPAIEVVTPGGFGFITASFDLRGRIESVGNAGILVSSGGGTPFGEISLSIQADGALAGASGLVVDPGLRSLSLSVFNRGTISADTGSALQSQSFLSRLINDETGRISAAGAAAAVAGAGGSITNAGLIANSGTGAAVSDTGALTLINSATGELRSASGVAVLAGASFSITNQGRIASGATAVRGDGGTLRNRGAIAGDVELGIDAGAVLLDNLGGTISGNVRLGDGDDVVFASFDAASAMLPGFGGAIDAGAGIDRLVFGLRTDTRIDSALALPGSFERIGFVVDDGATLTLAGDFAAPGALEIETFTGGTVINQVALSAAGPVVRSRTFLSITPAFNNEGQVTSTGSINDFAVNLSSGAINNTGTISATGGGVTTRGNVVNSGTITVVGTGVESLGQLVENSGTITSTAGIGVSGGQLISNSGTITGATAGVVARTGLNNSGTINGGVRMGGNAVIENRAGAVINGNVAVDFAAGSTAVRNAGTINGNVDFAPGGVPFLTSSLLVTLPGSRITGDVRLAPGTTLVTTLSAGGPAATIGGTLVPGSDARLRYLVDADASTRLDLPAGFTTLGYDLANDARLTIAGGGPLLRPLRFSGQGQVDLTATLAGNGESPLVDLTATPVQLMFAQVFPPPNRIDLVSRGSLVMARTAPSGVGTAAVVTGSFEGVYRFTNAGSIEVSNAAPTEFGTLAAVRGGGLIVNTGTIALGGAVGVAGVLFGSVLTELDNSGQIGELPGALASIGVQDVRTISNSGSIVTTGDAISHGSGFGPMRITNSGLLQSSGGAAIRSALVDPAIIVNAATGTIRGSQSAITANAAVIDNAGRIEGDVRLDRGFGIEGSAYLARGGTLAGDLRFGSRDDIFVAIDGVSGVAGVVDGGGGTDVFVQGVTTSTRLAIDSVALPATFEVAGFAALGGNTVLTITPGAATDTLRLLGNGTIINQADIGGGGIRIGRTNLPIAELRDAPIVENQGRVAGLVTGTVRGFINRAAITGAPDAPAVSLTGQGTAFRFENSGAIGGRAFIEALVETTSIANSGTIDGALGLVQRPDFGAAASAARDSTAITNSGTITANSAFTPALFYDGDAARITVANSGAIRHTGGQSAFNSNAVAIAGASGSRAIAFTNDGDVGIDGQGSAVALTARFTGTANRQAITLDNGGRIAATGGATLVSFGQLLVNAGVVASADAAESIVTIRNRAGASIVASGDLDALDFFGNPSALLASAGLPADAGNIGILAAAANTSITNDGDIIGGTAAAIPQRFTPSLAALPADAAGGAIIVVGGPATIHNNASGRIRGDIVLGDADDSLENRGVIAGTVRLGAGNDRFLHSLAVAPPAMVDAGPGTDRLIFDISGGGALTPGLFAAFTQFEAIGLAGTGTIMASGVLPVDTLALDGGSLTLAAGSRLATQGAVTLAGGAAPVTITNFGEIAGGVRLGAGADSLAVSGVVAGPVDMGSGDDRVTLLAGGRFGGAVEAGAGNDLLILVRGGSAAAPDTLDLGRVTGFETTRLDAGTIALAGSYATGRFDVAAGRLIGAAGTVLTAPQINVAAGATFGSAGMVVGNVAVAGTLSPGASPGTMSVIGNIALAAGSNTLMELGATVSDQLSMSGALAIAPGATLTLTGSRPVTPGLRLDLITAGGGITGSFTTINRAGGIQGFLSQSANRLSLFGAFAVEAGFNPQVAAAVRGVNATLAAGQAGPVLLAALPGLLTPAERANPSAFAQLTPEAHASAHQIGLTNGLAVSTALRSATLGQGDANGLFVFAEALAAWQSLGTDAATGTSRADVDSTGVLAGIGYGNAAASISLFAGRVDANQPLTGLGARNNADGIFAGATVRAAGAGFAGQVTLLHDFSDIDTRRALPGSGQATAGYRLRTTTLDATIGYHLALAGAWIVGPQLGYTGIWSRRDAVTEAGSAAFGLNVQRGSVQASFVDGSIRIAREAGTAAALRPWLIAGVRQQLSGRQPDASAGFGPAGPSFTVLGARRNETAALVGAGLAADISPRLALFAAYRGELAGDTSLHNLNGGLRLRF